MARGGHRAGWLGVPLDSMLRGPIEGCKPQGEMGSQMAEKRKRMKTPRGRINRGRKRIDPAIDREEVVDRIVELRADGMSFREAARQAGVHVATVCRWQARSPEVLDAMRDATDCASRAQVLARAYCRPRSVPWSDRCPECQGHVEVRPACGFLHFWRCNDRWSCGWKSWRPRFPLDCPKCGTYRLWSFSRKSVVCAGCGDRIGLAPAN
jgi:hypothetical protein